MRRTVAISKFSIDENIAYMIQQITQDSTQEILGYFHGIASYVGEDVAKNTQASRYVEKNIILFYKETAIPYRLRIGGGTRSENMKLDVSVGFPKKAVDQDVSALMTQIVESGLGLSDETDMPKFNKPILKTPRCLRSVRIEQEEKRQDKVVETV